jgi:hypothetical protein
MSSGRCRSFQAKQSASTRRGAIIRVADHDTGLIT